MPRLLTPFVVAALAIAGGYASARTTHIDGVITAYSSGNAGSDLFVKTANGKVRDLWFDNIRKPLFEGRELPWCPTWPVVRGRKNSF